MKRIITLGVVALILAGCSVSSHQAVMSNPEVLFTYNGKDYDENYIFQSLISSDTGAILINELESFAISKMKEETPIDITKDLEEQLAAIKAELGDDYDTYMTTYYGSAEAYISKILEPQVYLLKYFGAKLAETDLAAVKKEYDMKTLNVYYFTDETEANKVSTLLKESGDIDTMEAGIAADGKTSLIYTNQNTSFVDGMITKVAALKNTNDVAVYEDTENAGYYVFVQIDGELSDETVISTILEQTNYIDVKMGAYLKENYSFEVYDMRLKEQLSADYAPYLK